MEILAALKRLGEDLSAEEQVLVAVTCIRHLTPAVSPHPPLQHFLDSNASASLASFAAATDAVDEKSITVLRPCPCRARIPPKLLTRL